MKWLHLLRPKYIKQVNHILQIYNQPSFLKAEEVMISDGCSDVIFSFVNICESESVSHSAVSDCLSPPGL